MDREFIATLNKLKKQATDAERSLLSHIISMAELEAKNRKKAA